MGCTLNRTRIQLPWILLIAAALSFAAVEVLGRLDQRQPWESKWGLYLMTWPERAFAHQWPRPLHFASLLVIGVTLGAAYPGKSWLIGLAALAPSVIPLGGQVMENASDVHYWPFYSLLLLTVPLVATVGAMIGGWSRGWLSPGPERPTPGKLLGGAALITVTGLLVGVLLHG